MFAFLDQFDTLSNAHVTLKISEKVQGNDTLLPFYYYDIYENCTSSNKASRKIIEQTQATLKEIVKIPTDCFFYRENIEDYCIYLLEL